MIHGVEDQPLTCSDALLGTRELFERHNLRCTKQRVALFAALRACRHHPTAEELYRLVKPRTARLSLATVYNTLDVLCEAGLCRRLPTTNGCCRYDADTQEHAHVRFRDTGEIVDVPADLSAKLARHLPAEVLAEIEAELGVRIEGVGIQLLAARAPGSSGAPGNLGSVRENGRSR